MPGIVDQINALKAAQAAALANASVADQVATAGAAATKAGKRSNVVPSREAVVGAPYLRRGEDAMSSRPFSYKNMLAMMGGKRPVDQCRVEVEVMDEFQKSLANEYPQWSPQTGSFLIPLSLELMPEPVANAVKSVGFINGWNVDADEVAHVRRMTGANRVGGYYKSATKTMDQNTYSAGGSLIPNPAFGPLIDLARNTPGLFAAGAQAFPIPPQGAIDFPRVKTAPLADFVDGVDDDATDSDMGTDSMRLEAKMVSGTVSITNQLLMMSMPAAETIVQEQLILSVLLRFDYAGLFGTGGKSINGLINMVNQGVNQLTPSTVSVNGDTLAPQDWFNLYWTKCAQANQQFTGWIMNPRTYASTATFRADAVNAGDKAGLFVMKPLGVGLEEFFDGKYQATWTNQIPTNLTKGGGTELTTAFGGPWDKAVVGLFAALQALINPYETNAFTKNQTKIRVTGLGDFNVMYPTAFSFANNLTN